MAMTKKAPAKNAPKTVERPTDGMPSLNTRYGVCRRIGEKTGLTVKQIADVFQAYSELTKKELGKKGSGVVLLPGMAKIKARRIAATKEMTKPNPFKPGTTMTVKAKPARVRLKLSVLKAFREALV